MKFIHVIQYEEHWQKYKRQLYMTQSRLCRVCKNHSADEEEKSKRLGCPLGQRSEGRE